MAYTPPHTIAAGELVTTATMNNEWGGNVAFLANPPACRVFHNATQAVASGAEISVAFNSERFDTDSMHSSGSNTRITFNTAGLYIVSASFQFAPDPNGDWVVAYGSIRKNGTASIATQSQGSFGAISFGPGFTLTTMYKFAVADYVELRVSQTNGNSGSNNIQASDSTNAQQKCEFSATWVGLG